MVESVKSGRFNHVEWLDLEGNGVLVECAIMKKTENGDIYFFPITSLDQIDRQRLFNIITNRNAHLYELWDLMSQVTLGNGINALAYFHQIVRVLTPSGQTLDPTAGKMGARAVKKATGKAKSKKKEVEAEDEE